MQQIVIQSDWDDVSTDDVIRWIHFLAPGQFEILRLDNTTVIQNLTCKIENNAVSIAAQTSGGILKGNTTCSFWYRRGSFAFPAARIRVDQPGLKNIATGLQGDITREQQYIRDRLYSNLYARTPINTFHDNYTNKIENLTQAAKAGLTVPDTLVTNDMRELVAFAATREKIISKDIAFPPVTLTFNERYAVHIGQGIQLLTQQDIVGLSQRYESHPVAGFSLYQQYVEKRYELRIFYLQGRCYAMAIFSQANEKTKTDFRNYDNERPNRCAPYQLPGLLQHKIHRLMQAIGMNCGSLDMIVTPEFEFVFLEVNPVGQFQWLSRNCNYDIEQQLAIALINEDHGRAGKN